MLPPSLGIIVFVRMNSTRLPGKALMPLGGMPLLLRVIRRAQITNFPVFVATSHEADDDPIAALALEHDVPCFRGDKENVFQRAIDAAQAFQLEAFVRLCGDRPLFSIEEMSHSLLLYKSLSAVNASPDLITNHLFKQQVPGLTTELIRTQTLIKIAPSLIDDLDREHMTRYLYQHAAQFSLFSLPANLGNRNPLGYAVDTPADYERLAMIFNQRADLDLSVEEADRLTNTN